jgi:hypothetical protein
MDSDHAGKFQPREGSGPHSWIISTCLRYDGRVIQSRRPSPVTIPWARAASPATLSITKYTG